MSRAARCGHSQAMPHRAAPVRVFLADDSSLICDRVAAMLAGAGMTVVGRGDTPQACFDGILASQPDVVVLDVQLDGGSGLEVLQTVRLAAPAIAFVVFSNHSAPAYRRRYLGLGARQFIDKSTEFDQLATAVAQAAQYPTPEPDRIRSHP
jgi:two-component system response regulator DesR